MSFVPATSNRDLWAVLGLLVAGAVALAWPAFRQSRPAPPEDSGEAPGPPLPGESYPGHGTPQPRLS